MKSRNAPLVRQLFALLQEALAIASALQDNDDPISPNTHKLLGERLHQIQRQIDTAVDVAPLHRLMRGGSYSAYRNHDQPADASLYVGFRVVCLPQDNDHSIRLEGTADDYCLVRGGAWNNHPMNCHSTFRVCTYPSGNAGSEVGFRVVCLPQIGHAIRLEEQADD